MTNELFEFVRVLIYLSAAYGAFSLGIVQRRLAISFHTIALQFFIRSILLFFQANNLEEYRELNNWLGTPSIIFTTLMIFINLYTIRKE